MMVTRDSKKTMHWPSISTADTTLFRIQKNRGESFSRGGNTWSYSMPLQFLCDHIPQYPILIREPFSNCCFLLRYRLSWLPFLCNIKSPRPEILPAVPTGIWCATACCRRHGIAKGCGKCSDSAGRAQRLLELESVNFLPFWVRT